MELFKKRTKKRTDSDDKLTEIGLTVADIFTIPLVTDCIFNHLQYSDLLSCTLVSQAWNFQARDYLRRQRTNLLKCKIDDQVDSLQQLLDHLSDENNLGVRQLFTGVHVWIEEIDAWKFDVDSLNDLTRSTNTQLMLLIESWQGTTRTQLTELFGLFPMKHLIVTFKGYGYNNVPVIYFALDFMLPLLRDSQLETLKITGLVLKHSAKLLWAIFPIKGLPKLKTVQMGRRDYDLPLETKPLGGVERWYAIKEICDEERRCQYDEDNMRMNYLLRLKDFEKECERKDLSKEIRASIQSEIQVLTNKLLELNEPEN